MSELASWDELRAGANCPLCYPRPDYTEFLYFVRKLSVSSLYLSREQTYRGACALVYDVKHIVRIDQLSLQEWLDLANDLWRAESGVFHALKPDHINVENLGSTVPHLHWHILPRYKDDGRWGGPIWMPTLDDMPNNKLEETEYRDLASRINTEVDNAL